jgi:hypothetical protein
MSDWPDHPVQAIEAYREVMEQMAPDVVVVPAVYITTKDEPQEVYTRLRAISTEYARRMDWGWE